MKYLWKGIMAVVLTVCIVNCQNEDYLQDGGKHNPYYNGTVLEYLNQHPDKHYFSELTDLIHYAGLDSVLQNEEITFFAPTDFSIEKIGIQCGMKDANYFSRMFKKVEGISPGEYRRQW